jgi:FAD-dependent urate hydroxylase
MPDIDVAVVGAGPYGLSATAHLRRAGVDVRILGDPMSFWRTMPIGMMLRSNWTATCIGEYEGPLSLDSFRAATGSEFGKPVPLDRFIEYGTWVAEQVAPDVDRRTVRSLEGDGDGFRLHLADGDQLRARRVVVAAGGG